LGDFSGIDVVSAVEFIKRCRVIPVVHFFLNVL
jgi:hypothetical protein